MNLNVGDRFIWNRKRGSILRVEEVGPKIKFSVDGPVPMSGSMCPAEFRNQFLKQGKKVS